MTETTAREEAALVNGEAFYCEVCEVWSWTENTPVGEFVVGCFCE